MIEQYLQPEYIVATIVTIGSTILAYDYLKVKFSSDIEDTEDGYSIRGKLKLTKGEDEDESDGEDK